MATKPTPGPWEHNGNTVQSVGRHYSSTLVATTSMAPHFEHAEANARLIAAAPELLSDLRAAACYLDALGGDSSAYRKTIAKAEGK